MDTVKSLGVMIDCSRDAVYTVETLKEYISILAAMGYNSVQLYTEDTYEIAEEPYFGYLRGRYSKQKLQELDTYAKNLGVELIPCIQTLAHLGGITRWAEYKSCTDFGDILFVGEDRTYKLIENMFATCAECFTSRRINIGMDEAHMVGLGQFLDKHGYQKRYDILLRHLYRVNEIATKYGFKPMMWSDMFFRLAMKGEYYCADNSIPKDVIDAVPDNIDLIYWDYYSVEYNRYDAMISAHTQFRSHMVFAGGAWSWSGFAPVNRFSIQASKEALRVCAKHGVNDIFITCWKDDGAECSLFSTLPSLFCTAEFARGNFNMKDIADKFKNFIGIDFAAFMALDSVNICNVDEAVRNPSKYMLYSDPFLGMFDGLIVEKDAEKFADAKLLLLQTEKNKKFGYIFKVLIALCDVLEIKYALGVKTRRAYKSGDKNELSVLIGEYRELERRLEKFYYYFSLQWEKECKPNGFEKHDIRLGGLIKRVKHCRRMLTDFCNGRRNEISCLNEEILPIEKDLQKGDFLNFNRWHSTAMIKPLS